MPASACSVGFTRGPADFAVLPGAQKSVTFALSWPIVSTAESTANDPKSARVTVHPHENQWVARELIKQLICGVAIVAHPFVLVVLNFGELVLLGVQPKLFLALLVFKAQCIGVASCACYGADARPSVSD